MMYITPGLERTSQPGLTLANSTNASQNVHGSKNAPKTAVHQFPSFTWHPLLSIVLKTLQETLHDGPPSVSCDCFYFVCACSGSHIRNTICSNFYSCQSYFSHVVNYFLSIFCSRNGFHFLFRSSYEFILQYGVLRKMNEKTTCCLPFFPFNLCFRDRKSNFVW